MAIAQTRLLYKHIDQPGYTPDIKCYLKHGGYQALKKAWELGPEAVVQEVIDSQIRGRGGAGFPTGVKWRFINAKETKSVYLICNADESEPGTFKDRQLIYKDPHQVLEGILIAAYAIKAKLTFIYIRGEMYEGARILEQAIAEAKVHGFMNSGYTGEVVVHRGAGSYICGEETGLIESLEGKRPYPRIKPPYFPAVLGLYQCPTIVNNVETFCHVKAAITLGGKEYAKIGTLNNTGTRIWCVSGHVQKPGYYEFPCGGITLGQLIYDVCGGLLPGRTLKAVIPGGSSSKVLDAQERFTGKLKDGSTFEWGIEDIPMDFDSLVAVGSMSGSGAVIVLDDTTDMVEVMANINAFYAHESCGQCTPCREGSLWLKKISSRICAGKGQATDVDLMHTVANQVEGKTICAHGEALAWPTQSFVTKFRKEFLEKTSKPGSNGNHSANYRLI
jgi:NADH-quinone oxidoreductase subunit F